MTKKSLDYSLKLKMKHRAKEVQEELAFDMKLLEQMLTECSNDAKDNLERKVMLAIFPVHIIEDFYVDFRNN